MVDASMETGRHYEEVELKPASGMLVLICNTAFMLAALSLFVLGCITLDGGGNPVMGGVLLAIGIVVGFILAPILYIGLRIVKPNEAIVLVLFGKYIGTIKKEGFFFVNPFAVGVNPAASASTVIFSGSLVQAQMNKKISLKVSTLSNEKQKINDELGNPIVIGIVVIWRVVNTAKAVFSVSNYKEFLSIQCDSALRNIVRLYPYDANGDDNEKTLRGSSQEIAEKLKEEIQEKVQVAGLEIMEARITHLSYAEEIAAVMLQRQQASAIVDARQMIVEGAVGMVEMALEKLSEKQVVQLDEERKAAMVSNLLVVLCGNKDAQPIVNSGSIYNV